MTGREMARRLLGLTRTRPQLRAQFQPKGWDYPESSEELQRLTGLTWRRLDIQPMMTAMYRTGQGWSRFAREAWDPLWTRAWAARYNGWLIIYDAEELEGEPGAVSIGKVALPEADLPTMERIAGVLEEMLGEGGLVETGEPRLPYVLWVPTFQELGPAFGVGPEPHILDQPRHLLWELRLVQSIVDALQEG